MQILIYLGVITAAGGLGGVVWCILEAVALKRSGQTVEEAKPRLRRMGIVNMISVAVAFLGIAIAAVGLILR